MVDLCVLLQYVNYRLRSLFICSSCFFSGITYESIDLYLVLVLEVNSIDIMSLQSKIEEGNLKRIAASFSFSFIQKVHRF